MPIVRLILDLYKLLQRTLDSNFRCCLTEVIEIVEYARVSIIVGCGVEEGVMDCFDDIYE